MWLLNVAMEGGPFIDEHDDLPNLKKGDFPVRKALNNKQPLVIRHVPLMWQAADLSVTSHGEAIL